MFGSKRSIYLRHKTGERINQLLVLPTVKHIGGSVMI